MEVKNRTIIITDPCYIAKDKDWGNGINYSNYSISLPQFTDYLWSHTGFGDGTGEVFLTYKPLSQLELEGAILTENTGPFKSIGDFSVDSGSYGVFYYDEVLDYNPDFAMEIGSWCYTVIPDFTGAVYFTSLSNDEEGHVEVNYIIGSGNKSFFTL